MNETPGGHLESRDVAAYLDRALGRAGRERVESHLAGCAECRQEVIEVSRIKGASRRPLRWLIAVPAVAAAVVVFLIARPDASPPGGPVLRDGGRGSAARVELVAPAADRAVNQSSLVFRWRSVGENVSYRISVTDRGGDVVWSSSTTDTTARLGGTAPLRSGSSYHWYVDALLPDGRSIASAVHAFTVQ